MLLLLYSNTFIDVGTITRTVVDTVTYSQHPVNCIMAGNVPFKARETEWDIPPAGTKEKASASRSPAMRLSKNAPSSTTVTKRGDRFFN